MSPTRPSARPRRDAVSTRRSDARAAGCSPGSSPTRACRPRRAPNTTSTRTSPRPRASTGPGTTARSPPATCSWTRPSACSPTMRTPTPHTSAARTRPQRAHPPLPAQENQLRRPHGRGPAGHRPGDQRHPMKVLDWETPNEVWYHELGKVMSKTSHPKTSVALTN